jgi:hydroxyquinol 1,2-dioxygenase
VTEPTLPERVGDAPAPWREPGADIAAGAAGAALFVGGQVRSTDGTPLAGAELEAWHAGAEGEYDSTSPALPRGRWRCGDDGRYRFRTVLPTPYALARDGPLPRLLDALGREPWRPAHLHFVVQAPGHVPVATHVFQRGSPYLDDDAAFGVRQSLVAEWVHHEPGVAPDGTRCEEPFHSLQFDFVLEKSAA